MHNQDDGRPTKRRPQTKPIGIMTDNWLGSNEISKDLKDQWINNGFSVLKGAFTSDEIDRYNAIVAKVRTEIDDGKDEHGFGDRIGQLHQKEPQLLELASNKFILNFLRWAFNDDPVLFGSLNFEKGTQQDAHIDAIFFWPEPSYSMAGCWIALEDISLDAGPLFYVPGSHKWPFYHSEDVVLERPDLAALRDEARDSSDPEVRAKAVEELGRAWTSDLRSLEAEHQTERTPLRLKAGDVVFWHSLLAHGGSPRLNPQLSRKSVVFHYIGQNTNLYTFEQFMLHDNSQLPELQEQPKAGGNYKGVLPVIEYGHFVTYSGGKQHIHPVTREASTAEA